MTLFFLNISTDLVNTHMCWMHAAILGIFWLQVFVRFSFLKEGLCRHPTVQYQAS